MQQYQGAGTINDPSDEDEDRTVEIAFPLEGIRRPARRPVPPEAGDVADKFLPLRVSGNYHRRLTVTGSGRFGQHYSDDLEELGWEDGEDLEYLRLEGVTHRWQPQYNEQVWEFLMAHPMDLDEAAE